MCSWRDAPNPQPTYQPPAASTFLIFFMPVVKKVQMQSENVTFWTLPRVLSQFSCEIWSIWACMCVWYSVYIYNACDIHSSKQVTIMCRAWYLQLRWQENWILLRTAHLVTTLILERLLQHAEGVLNFQQAHENHTPVFSCWCVCVFSELHMPCRCRQEKGRRKVFCPLWLTCTLVICKQKKYTQTQAIHMTYKNLAQDSTVWISAKSALSARTWKGRRRMRGRTVSAWGKSGTLVSCS